MDSEEEEEEKGGGEEAFFKANTVGWRGPGVN